MLISLFLALFTATTPALAISGVIDVKSGSLRVQRDDQMKSSFYPGQYKSEISFADSKAYLMIERKEVRTDVTVNLPAGTQIPENGTVDIDGFRTGQTFAMQGTIATVKDNSEPLKEYEACFYQRQDWMCEGYGPHYHCGWVNHTVEGQRPVEYYFENKTVTLALNLDSHNGGLVTFSGNEKSSRKIYTYQGNCY